MIFRWLRRSPSLVLGLVNAYVVSSPLAGTDKPRELNHEAVNLPYTFSLIVGESNDLQHTLAIITGRPRKPEDEALMEKIYKLNKDDISDLCYYIIEHIEADRERSKEKYRKGILEVLK